MIPDIDIWRTAKLLIDKHGADASIYAAMRADKLFADGELDGRAVWLRIIWAIDEIQTKEVPEGAIVN